MTVIVVGKELENLRRVVDQRIEKGDQFEWGEGLVVVNNLLLGVIQISDLALAMELVNKKPDNFKWTEKGFIVTGTDRSCFELSMSPRENSSEVTIGYSAPDMELIEYHLFMNQREFLQSTATAFGEVCGVNEVKKTDYRGKLARNMFSFIGSPTTDNMNTLPERLKKMLVFGN